MSAVHAGGRRKSLLFSSSSKCTKPRTWHFQENEKIHDLLIEFYIVGKCCWKFLPYSSRRCCTGLRRRRRRLGAQTGKETNRYCSAMTFKTAAFVVCCALHIFTKGNTQHIIIHWQKSVSNAKHSPGFVTTICVGTGFFGTIFSKTQGINARDLA